MNEPKGKILFRWMPPPEIKDDAYAFCADEYLVISRADAPGGCIIYGLYHNEWMANTPDMRPLVMELLRRAEAVP